jgi:hypothetical protein
MKYTKLENNPNIRLLIYLTLILKATGKAFICFAQELCKVTFLATLSQVLVSTAIPVRPEWFVLLISDTVDRLIRTTLYDTVSSARNRQKISNSRKLKPGSFQRELSRNCMLCSHIPEDVLEKTLP